MPSSVHVLKYCIVGNFAGTLIYTFHKQCMTDTNLFPHCLLAAIFSSPRCYSCVLCFSVSLSLVMVKPACGFFAITKGLFEHHYCNAVMLTRMHARSTPV